MATHNGMSLAEYRDTMKFNIKFQIQKNCNWPDSDLVLSVDERKFICQSRSETEQQQVDEDHITGSDLTIAEAEKIIDMRVESASSWQEFEKSYSAAEVALKDKDLTERDYYVMPYFRHVIVFRKPTQSEYDEHQITLEDIDQAKNFSSKDTIRRRRQSKIDFVNNMLVYPKKLPGDKLNITDQSYIFIIQVSCDEEMTQFVKIRR